MSLKAMTAVWEDSHSRGNDRLVLLAIADAASADDGTGAYLHQDTIAMKAGVSVRTVQRCITDLKAEDELRVEREHTRIGNSYTVVVAWKRSIALARRHADEPQRNTRQSDVWPVDAREKKEEHSVNPAIPEPSPSTHDNLTCVTQHDSGNPETRQIDGGKFDTHDNAVVSHTPPVGVPDPSTNPSLSPRARPVRLTSVPDRHGSIVPRGGSVKWERDMERQHANCHPEVCHWRDPKVRECMPIALVSRYAQKLPIPESAALDDVIAWARTDAPPPDYVASGDIYEHWRLRWDLTRATAPASPGARAAAVAVRAVPGAADTDALIDELTAGRVPPGGGGAIGSSGDPTNAGGRGRKISIGTGAPSVDGGKA